MRHDPGMTTFAYDDRSAVRDEVRPAHRAYLAELHRAGVLVASGPFTDDGAPGARLLVRGADAADVHRVPDADPFWVEGLVAERSVRPWQLVLRSWEE